MQTRGIKGFLGVRKKGHEACSPGFLAMRCPRVSLMKKHPLSQAAVHSLDNLKRPTAVALEAGKKLGRLILQTEAPGKGWIFYNKHNKKITIEISRDFPTKPCHAHLSLGIPRAPRPALRTRGPQLQQCGLMCGSQGQKCQWVSSGGIVPTPPHTLEVVHGPSIKWNERSFW